MTALLKKYPNGPLDPKLKDPIIRIWEDHRLVRDVGNLLTHSWNDDMIAKITARHNQNLKVIEYVARLYKVKLPRMKPGRYQSFYLQMLYKEAVKENYTRLGAISVFAKIEEQNLRDLLQFILIQENPKMRLFILNMTRRSRNNLRVLVFMTRSRGENYQSVFVGQPVVEEIIKTRKETALIKDPNFTYHHTDLRTRRGTPVYFY